TSRDFFSIQGARETTREVSRVYKAYGEEDSFGMVEDDSIHTYTQKNREAMYRFFQKSLDNPGSQEDKALEPLKEEELQVTRTGQVATSFDGETVFSLNYKLAQEEQNKLEVSRKKNLSSHLPKAVRNAKKLSGYREPDSMAKPVFT